MSRLPMPEKITREEKRDHKIDRIPIGGNRDILTVIGKEAGFVYRWVLDRGNRIEKFKRAGYEIVTHDVSVGDARAAIPSQVGSGTYALSGNADKKLVLMRVREEYYQEDQDSKEAGIRSLEESMGKNIDGSYGKVDVQRK